MFRAMSPRGVRIDCKAYYHTKESQMGPVEKVALGSEEATPWQRIS